MVSLQDELVEIERQLWKNDPISYRQNYTDDALITFPETGVIDIEFALEAIRRENAEGRHWAEIRFEDVRILPVTDDVTLLLYKAVARWEHETTAITSLATTAYVRRAGRWRAAHHQQSRVETDPTTRERQ